MTPSLHPRDLLLGLLLLALVVEGVRAGRGPPRLGPPHAALPCARPVEDEGAGVRCDSDGEHVRAGDRLRDGRVVGRMAPARLRAFDAPVDLNRASVAELASLDGVGAKIAARIVAARPFRSVDELARVRGLGARRLTRLRPRLVVSTVTNDARREPARADPAETAEPEPERKTLLLDDPGTNDL